MFQVKGMKMYTCILQRCMKKYRNKLENVRKHKANEEDLNTKKVKVMF